MTGKLGKMLSCGLAAALLAFYAGPGQAATPALHLVRSAIPASHLVQIAGSDEDCDAADDCSDTGNQTPKTRQKTEKHKKPGAVAANSDCDAGEDCSDDAD